MALRHRHKDVLRELEEEENKVVEVQKKPKRSYGLKDIKSAIGRVVSSIPLILKGIVLVIRYFLSFTILGDIPGHKSNAATLTRRLFVRRFFIFIDNIIASLLFTYFTFWLSCVMVEEYADPSLNSFWNDYCLGPSYGGLTVFAFTLFFFFRRLYYSDRPCWENLRNKKFLKYWLYGNLCFPLVSVVIYLLRFKLFYSLIGSGDLVDSLGTSGFFMYVLDSMIFLDVAVFRFMLHDFKRWGMYD